MEKIASSCASNEYLERLFQVYARSQDKLKVGVLYREKFLSRAQNEGMLMQPSAELQAKEAEFRQQLQAWYGGLGRVDIKTTIYVNHKYAREWEKLVLGENGTNELREGFYYDEVKYERASVALGLTVAYVYPGRALVDQEEVLFEELYHASKGGFTPEQKAVWAKAGSFFEEGLAKLEVHNYLGVNEGKQAMTAEGTRRWNRSSVQRGEEAIGDTSTLEHSAGALMLLISKQLGGKEFIAHLRAARAGNEAELVLVKDMIDQRFGEGIYQELTETGGYQVNKINRMAEKMGLLETTRR